MEELLHLSLGKVGIPPPTYIVLFQFTFLVFFRKGFGGGELIFGVAILQHPAVPKLIQDLLTKILCLP